MSRALQTVFTPLAGLLGVGAGVVLAAMLQGGAASAQGSAGDPGHGKELFQERCGICHTAAPDDGDGGQGPPLKGVVGRKAAAVAGFNYTAALRKSGKVWTRPALDHFLAGPRADVPGTAMPVSVTNPKDRADLIAYLATVK